jgi:Type I phosphodiesterase / nucleotide pyrophosphatase
VSRRRMVFLAFAVSMMMATWFAAPAQAAPKPPSRVVIIMLDQARPDTITRYGMTNVQELQRKGESFPNAYVGHMAAETVISHNVITSGQLPKHMGWSNEVYRDTDGVLGAPGAYHVTSSMSCAQFKALIEHGNYPKIQDYLDAKFGQASPFASFTQKRTSACTSGHTSPAADGTGTDPEDIIFQIRGSAAPLTPDPNDDPAARVSCDGRSSWRQPESGNGTLPAYFDATAPCNRWWTWQGSGAYGTGALSPANIYPLDGDRFVPGIPSPGFPAAHVGGDNWSTDAVIRFIENEDNWHGMMVSLGGIDKLGHMWGPEDQGEAGAAPGSVEEMRHLPFIAKNADAQVGRIVDALEAKGLLDETLIVITADHAAQTGRPFHGVLAPGVTNPLCAPPSTGIRSDCNWYFGSDSDEIYRDPSPAVAQLRDALGGNLAFSYQDTQVATWLNNTAPGKKHQAAAAVLDMPDVVASYEINAAQNDYRLFGTNPMTSAERSWFLRHAEELVDTMAASNAPDVVGITATDVTYGVMGDHGGAQQLVQRIPMVFYGAGVGSRDSNQEIRLVDVMPTILTAMGIQYDATSLDGEAVALSR